MPGYAVKPLIIGIAVVIWLKFLLPATGWMFYELHHATGIDWFYWGYSVFRGGGYFFSTWAYQTIVCLIVGLLTFLLLARRGKRRQLTEA